MSGDYAFNCDGFLVALHCSLSIQRFYEPAGNIVNDMTKFWYDALRQPRRDFTSLKQLLCIKACSSRDVNYDVEICK